jgi:hypothetical protein
LKLAGQAQESATHFAPRRRTCQSQSGKSAEEIFEFVAVVMELSELISKENNAYRPTAKAASLFP